MLFPRFVSMQKAPVLRSGFTAALSWGLSLSATVSSLACAPEAEESTVRVRLAAVGNSGHGSCQAQGAGKNNCGAPSDEGSSEEEGQSGGISVVDEDGEPVAVSWGDARVEVRTRAEGEWEPALDVELRPETRPHLDVALVADNSGGLRRDLLEIRKALSQFSHAFLAPNKSDRVGLVRVSTDARVVQELTSDSAAVQHAIDDLFITNGWTALWDGVRIANQMLEQGQLEPIDDGLTCFSGAYPVIVVMTDGMENNSAAQMNTKYPGDGVDTFFEDLLDLRVGGRQTVVHTVGVGKQIDEPALRELADGSGGVYRPIKNYGRLLGALRSMSNQLGQTVPICFRPADCSHDQALVELTFTHGGEEHSAELTTPLRPSCDDRE